MNLNHDFNSRDVAPGARIAVQESPIATTGATR